MTCFFQTQHSQQCNRHCLLSPLMSPKDTKCHDWLIGIFCLQEAVADGGHSAQQKAPLKQSQRRLQKAAQRAPAGSQNTATDPVLDWIFNAHQPYHANDQGVPGKEHFLLPRLLLLGTVVVKGVLLLSANTCVHALVRFSAAACHGRQNARALTHWLSSMPAEWLISLIKWRSFCLSQACLLRLSQKPGYS